MGLALCGAFVETTGELPQFLHDQRIAPIITPIATTTGRLSTPLKSFAVILYRLCLSKTRWRIML